MTSADPFNHAPATTSWMWERRALEDPRALAELEQLAAGDPTAAASSRLQPTAAQLQRTRARLGSPELASAVWRLALARRKGRTKFADADRLWLDLVAVEQATAPAVALWKASRLVSAAGGSYGSRPTVILDLCCGVGSDALALAQVGANLVALDRDAGMIQRVTWNARVRGVDKYLRGVVGNAAHPPCRLIGGWLHVDPDRRPGQDHRRARQRRAVTIAGYQPGPDVLERLIERTQGGAVKFSPADDWPDFAARLEARGIAVEVEVISWMRECKEATLWYGAAAEVAGARRRATALPSGRTWTDCDARRVADGTLWPSSPSRESCPRGAFLFDPDPCLERAGLLDGFARAWGLTRLEPALGCDWLMIHGDEAETMERDRLASLNSWGGLYRVESEGPADLKFWRARLREMGVGRVVVKTQRWPEPAEAVQRRLTWDATARLEGWTLFLQGGTSRRARAILAWGPMDESDHVAHPDLNSARGGTGT